MKTDWFRGSYLSVSSRRRMASTIGRSLEQRRRSPPLASSAQDRDRAFQAKRRWEDKLSRAKGLFPCLQCPGVQDRDRAFQAKRRREDKPSRAKGLFPRPHALSAGTDSVFPRRGGGPGCVSVLVSASAAGELLETT